MVLEQTQSRGKYPATSVDNFIPGNLKVGMLQGMCDELYEIKEKT